ncbi:MAG: hypothetical protein Q8N36_01835, partial [bacterium]|nr:hypothetical protein [bacterium]
GAMLRKGDPLFDYLEAVLDKKGRDTGWYILLNTELYSPSIGLDSSCTDQDDFFIVSRDHPK